MKVNLDNSTDDAQIQIVPLIDVIFCILTFFIIAVIQTKQPQAVNVDLPQAKTGTVQAPDRLIITLMGGGQLTVGTESILDRTALIDRAKTYLTQRPDGLLVLNASQNAIYSEVISVLDALREVGGARRVALATNPKTEPTPTPNPYLPNPYSNPYSNPNPFPTTTPGSNLYPDSTNPGGIIIPGGAAPIPSSTPIAPGTGIAPNGTLQNPAGPQQNLAPGGVQDFNKRTESIPLSPNPSQNR